MSDLVDPVSRRLGPALVVLLCCAGAPLVAQGELVAEAVPQVSARADFQSAIAGVEADLRATLQATGRLRRGHGRAHLQLRGLAASVKGDRDLERKVQGARLARARCRTWWLGSPMGVASRPSLEAPKLEPGRHGSSPTLRCFPTAGLGLH